MVFKKAVRNSKNLIQKSSAGSHADLLMERDDLLNPLSIGSWTPPIDKCQTDSHVVIRAELPGVESSDVSVSFKGDTLRIHGVKREPISSRKLLCYFCLERSFGRFDRTLRVSWIVNPRQATAHLDKGILTIQMPKINDRRGEVVKIKII